MSAIMPGSKTRATAQITPLGTLRRGFTASSEQAAAQLEQDPGKRAEQPCRAKRVDGSGFMTARGWFVRSSYVTGNGLDLTPPTARTAAPRHTTCRGISVNTAMLLTRAAQPNCMLIDVMINRQHHEEFSATGEHQPLARVAHIEPLSSSGRRDAEDGATPADGHVERPPKPDENQTRWNSQPGASTDRHTGEGDRVPQSATKSAR